jgi:hypothetical protein
MIDTIIGLAVIGGIGYALYKMVTKKETAKEAVEEVIAEAKAEVVKVADVNNDGKVDVADVADVVEAVKKTRGRKKKAQ